MTTDMDVLKKYDELVTQSLAGDSAYIRSKETMQELFDDGTMTGPDKAAVISQVLSSLNASVMSTSTQTALQWTEAEKSLELKKLEIGKQLDILDQDKDLREAQVDKTGNDDIIAQVCIVDA